jgi:hypothetical protein
LTDGYPEAASTAIATNRALIASRDNPRRENGEPTGKSQCSITSAGTKFRRAAQGFIVADVDRTMGESGSYRIMSDAFDYFRAPLSVLFARLDRCRKGA